MDINKLIGTTIPTEPVKKVDTDTKVHIRVKQRNGRKSWTIIHGLNEELNLKKDILKPLRKKLCCNGALKEDDTGSKILEFQGDHRDIIKKYLIDKKYCEEDDIVTHGF
jgi:translation initiation factor 1